MQNFKHIESEQNGYELPTTHFQASTITPVSHFCFFYTPIHLPLSAPKLDCYYFLQLFFKIKKIKFFIIITNSHEVVRKNTERSHVSFAHFSPLVTSCKSIGQYPKQDIDMDVVKIKSISITTRIPHVAPCEPYSLLS